MSRMTTCRTRWAITGVLGVIVALTILIDGCQHGGTKQHRRSRADRTIRAIWVTRWDYKTPHDIVAIMDNARSSGFNTVLFQVRGNGTVLYRSRIEPWASELGGRDPGFDPLDVACREAHRRGLALHAWANVVPGWRGKKPPTDRRQLYHAHADWFWRDATGRRQPLGWYNSLNPCYPEVRQYIASVMREIVAGYPVDGLHMDYIRFPNEWNASYPKGASVPDYPRDPRTLAMFRRATGQTPESNPAAWNAWRTEQVTRLVRDIRTTVKRARPKVMLTAAVNPLPDHAKQTHFQDTLAWIDQRLIDAVFPMNYDRTAAGFRERLDTWAPVCGRMPVVMGIMFDQRDSGLVVEQLRQTPRTGGHFAAFAYNSMFERLDGQGRARTDQQSASRSALRRDVIPRVRRIASESARVAIR